MTTLQRVLREYNLIMGVVTAFIAMALGLGWVALTPEQIGLVLAFIAAVFVLLRFIVTPTSDPVLPVGTVVNAHTSKFPTASVVGDD